MKAPKPKFIAVNPERRGATTALGTACLRKHRKAKFPRAGGGRVTSGKEETERKCKNNNTILYSTLELKCHFLWLH